MGTNECRAFVTLGSGGSSPQYFRDKGKTLQILVYSYRAHIGFFSRLQNKSLKFLQHFEIFPFYIGWGKTHHATLFPLCFKNHSL